MQPPMQHVVCSSPAEQQRGQAAAAASLHSFPLETGTPGNDESEPDEEDVEQMVSKVSCVMGSSGRLLLHTDASCTAA